MKETILEKLSSIEKDHDVKILYACESGSRGWGFASQDSDYDVRFIYVHKKDCYLSLDQKRDVIEQPINYLLDINGWDIKKALMLFYKSNPTLYEWLDSPIVYRDDHGFVDDLKKLIPDYFSAKACFHHYLSMLTNNYADYANKEEIKLKKYFYVLRPLFACHWLKEFNKMPPMEFQDLLSVSCLENDLRKAIDELLEIKIKSAEQDLQQRIPLIDQFVLQGIEELTEFAKSVLSVQSRSLDKLNDIFRDVLNKA
ncbi:MAG: nucleotidyltransferase domain-containing protein [Candidatus Omnitrophica bacterium]|nr:nucleotidyltransferase domain-containing protein [Candidatus Omnitrophota bacterium]MCB9747921.1 nucleotidyltransferase domain-containing protein [Candidatus Omnitrophota bacterium]